MKTICYLRVSTDQQDLNSQKLEIEKYAEKHDLVIDKFIEIKISSRKNEHARRINELLSSLKRGDRLIVSEISRLARSIRQTHNILHALARKKIETHILKQNLVFDGEGDMNTKIYLNAFSLAAEIEKDLISRRTKSGLEAARRRGVKLGNPNLPRINKNTKKAADKFAETLRDIVTALVDQGQTQRQIMDSLSTAGIRTRQDCNWTLTTVQRLLKRLNLKTKHTKGGKS